MLNLNRNRISKNENRLQVLIMINRMKTNTEILILKKKPQNL